MVRELIEMKLRGNYCFLIESLRDTFFYEPLYITGFKFTFIIR